MTNECVLGDHGCTTTQTAQVAVPRWANEHSQP
jgi:hypothetical protein